MDLMNRVLGYNQQYICIIYIYIQAIGVRWRRRCEIRLSPRELDSQGTVFFSVFFVVLLFVFCFFGGHYGWRVELDHFYAGRALTPHKGDGRITYYGGP